MASLVIAWCHSPSTPTHHTSAACVLPRRHAVVGDGENKSEQCKTWHGTHVSTPVPLERKGQLELMWIFEMPKQAAPEIALFFRLGNAKLEWKADLSVLILRPESLNLGCFWPQEPHLTWLLRQRSGYSPWQASWSPESNLCSFLPSACHPLNPRFAVQEDCL